MPMYFDRADLIALSGLGEATAVYVKNPIGTGLYGGNGLLVTVGHDMASEVCPGVQFIATQEALDYVREYAMDECPGGRESIDNPSDVRAYPLFDVHGELQGAVVVF